MNRKKVAEPSSSDHEEDESEESKYSEISLSDEDDEVFSDDERSSEMASQTDETPADTYSDEEGLAPKKKGGNRRPKVAQNSNINLGRGGAANDGAHSDGDMLGDELEPLDAPEVGADENMWTNWRRRNAARQIELDKKGPWFTHAEHILDAEERKPDDPDYDPSTLFIPKSEWTKFTPGMKRYWQTKSQHFDSIVFYRWARWFIVYYQDAAICSKYMDLMVPPRQTLRIVGFPEHQLQANIEVLVNKGHKVAICEQTETMEMMKERVKELKKNKDKEGD